jgi:uncharacterized iron-regulated membrane protein
MSSAETRRLWLDIHRYAGLASVALLLVAGLTGCILVVDKPLDAALNPDLFRLARPADRVEPISAVVRFEAAHPELRVTSVPLRTAPGESLRVRVQPRRAGAVPGFDEAFLGPAGEVRGVRATGPSWGRRGFVQGVYQFHYTLLAGTPGRWLMGLAACVWLASNLVGLYLTLPRRGPFWKAWAPAWKVALRARLAKVLLDLHQASGLWLLAPLTVLAFTSVSMNFFDEAFIPAAQALSPARPSPFDRPAPVRPPEAGLDFGQALTAARAQALRLRIGGVPGQADYLADRGLYEVQFTPGGDMTYTRLGPVALYLEGHDGRLAYVDDPYSDSAGRKATRALYPLHSGQVAGWPTEVLAFILGFATVAQGVTGLYLWLKRRGPRIAAARAKAAARARAAA